MRPSSLVIDEDANKIYVANKGSDSVSVIDGYYDIKEGLDIPVGRDPRNIAEGISNLTHPNIYVATDNSVSVIDSQDYTKIKNIPAISPQIIAANTFLPVAYVIDSNKATGTVSVIINATKIRDIPVGVADAIATAPTVGKIYVANPFSHVVVLKGAL